MQTICAVAARGAALIMLLNLVPVAQAANPYVPPDLRDWEEWVLHDAPEAACPIAATSGELQPACVWPGRLHLTVSDSGGQFSQNVEVFAESWFVLPGTGDAWPQDVTVEGRPAVVIAQNQRPAIRLPAGKHNVDGRFTWPRLPKSLLPGSGTGLVSLIVNGETVPRPRWSGNVIWIGQNDNAGGEADNQVGVSVYRTISDGAPAYLDVTLQIDISGESREEVIGRLLPAGFTPAGMTAPLPARLDNNGQLRIQARPGQWEFHFRARTPGPISELVFAPEGEHWPQEEVWSFAFDPRLRVTEATAAAPVDPVQAGVPQQYQNLPSFRMSPGEQLSIVERQRGPSDSEKDRLRLSRSLWLDFDRGGYTARDTIEGLMVHNWRLDVVPPFELQSGSLTRPDGATENLLVTENPDDASLRGVEIRTPQVNLVALLRLENYAGHLPVSGWRSRLERVDTNLFLPPGHRLLYAAGADRDPRSWLNQWNLLDFFLVLVVTVAIWRMYAPWLGIIALLALSLSLHEHDAPVWMWLNLIAALALAKYLPTGRALSAARSYKILSFIALVLWALPFAANQLKLAIYPQLEFDRVTIAADMAPQRGGFVDEITVTGSVAETPAIESEVRQRVESYSVARKSNVINRYDKNARVQTGPGVPKWNWRNYPLGWTGPVVDEQTTRLWIAPPWLMTLWRIAMVVLIFGLLAALLRRDPIRLSTPATRQAASAMLVLLTGIVTVLPASEVYAQTPDTQLLKELKNRLTEAPKCAPSCIDIPRGLVRFDDSTLSVELIAHAETAAAISVPGHSNGWHPESITMDGRSLESLRTGTAGHFELLLTPGVHRIVLRGALPNSNSVALAFPLVPRFLEVRGDGWEVTGINDNRLAGGALTLIRQRDDKQGETLDDIDVEQFPAFVTVRRELSIDLDWTVTTTVMRLTPKTAAINLQIPLIDGESVTSEDLKVEDNHAIVNLATGQKRLTWRSTLARNPQVSLHAATGQPWQEQWMVSTGASWRLLHSGVPEMISDRSQESTWQLHFTPWPGEDLMLDISRPTAVSGPTLAIDDAALIQRVGHRVTESELRFSYRATRGSQHAIVLPPDSELESVSSGGRPMSLALENGVLRVPVSPGAHAYAITWRNAGGSRFIKKGGQPDLGIAASNLSSSTVLAANRWTIWTYGPTIGPAVLYWSELAVFVVVAFGLARFARTPLKFVHWLLLGLGFSTFFWPAFAVVAVMLLAHSWREQNVIENRWRFDLVQLALAALIVAAAIALVTAIPLGLLGTPDMHIAGSRNWFIDQSEGPFPATGVVSLPLWVYKALILVWALWLAFALMRWLPWIWRAFSNGGYWKRLKPALAVSADDIEPRQSGS
ncbi:MAG: hypothetical protein OER80_08160 [Gammaproteobacteria bacterium]|nr:hypothetical protein [Gammaproteobacteria bacterium]